MELCPVNEPPEAQQAPPGFVEQVKSFPASFWVANSIELVERFSFYGVRTM